MSAWRDQHAFVGIVIWLRGNRLTGTIPTEILGVEGLGKENSKIAYEWVLFTLR